MKIIITGDGKVGHTLSENLSKDGNDVTIIDKNPEPLKRSDELLDVMVIKGSGANVKTLIEAGVKEADILIAATNSDEVNMVCCFTAKRLGAKKTIARIRDPEYADDLIMLRRELGLDMIINPEMSAADEIANLMRFSSAVSIESFSKGRVELVEIKVTHDQSIINRRIKDLPIGRSNSALIGAVVRDGDVYIPNGEFVLKENDNIFVIGVPRSVYDYCSLMGKCSQNAKNAMIVGGGRIAYYLTNLLMGLGIKVKIVENDKERCKELSEMLPNTLIIFGDGTEEELLRSEGIEDMDVFISMTGSDEENLMSAMLAKQFGVANIIPKVSRTNYIEVIKKMGIDKVVNPKTVITNHILQYVRGIKNAGGNKIEALHRIIDGKAEILEFIAGESISFLDKNLADLKFKKNILIAAIVRNNDVIIPHGKNMIKKGDRVIIITKREKIIDLNEIIHNGGIQVELQNGFKKLGDITGP
jgi:trk system potassium uptake protein